jgi:hypothetical protein
VVCMSFPRLGCLQLFLCHMILIYSLNRYSLKPYLHNKLMLYAIYTFLHLAHHMHHQHTAPAICISLQSHPLPQHRAIPHHRAQPHHIDQTTHSMEYSKPLIQLHHLLTMRPLIPTLLPIPRLLMFAQPHDLCRLRAHIHQIHQRGDKHRRDEIQVGFVGGGGTEQGPRVCEPES